MIIQSDSVVNTCIHVVNKATPDVFSAAKTLAWTSTASPMTFDSTTATSSGSFTNNQLSVTASSALYWMNIAIDTTANTAVSVKVSLKSHTAAASSVGS